MVFFAVVQKFYESHRSGEVVEDNNVLIEDVEQIGRIVFCAGLVLDGDLFEISYSVEGGVAVETAVFRR